MAEDKVKVKIGKFVWTLAFGKCKLKIICIRKSYINLSQKKPNLMKEDECNLLGRQVLGATWLSLFRNFAFNIAKDKTTTSLLRSSF
jgi:hypothetical protein